MAPINHHRGYGLQLLPIDGGWSVRLCDPAGHPADVTLHEQRGHEPWPTAAGALAAAREHVDQLLSQDSSY